MWIEREKLKHKCDNLQRLLPQLDAAEPTYKRTAVEALDLMDELMIRRAGVRAILSGRFLHGA